jgi:hypothetical protein
MTLSAATLSIMQMDGIFAKGRKGQQAAVGMRKISTHQPFLNAMRYF